MQMEAGNEIKSHTDSHVDSHEAKDDHTDRVAPLATRRSVTHRQQEAEDDEGHVDVLQDQVL